MTIEGKRRIYKKKKIRAPRRRSDVNKMQKKEGGEYEREQQRKHQYTI